MFTSEQCKLLMGQRMGNTMFTSELRALKRFDPGLGGYVQKLGGRYDRKRDEWGGGRRRLALPVSTINSKE